MIKLRAERPVSVGDFCVIKDKIHDMRITKAYSRKLSTFKMSEFESFFVIKDSVYGNKGLSVIIPFKHESDNNAYNLYYMHTFLKKNKPRTYIVYTSTLERTDKGCEGHYPSKNPEQVGSVVNFINKIQLNNSLVQIQY